MTKTDVEKWLEQLLAHRTLPDHEKVEIPEGESSAVIEEPEDKDNIEDEMTQKTLEEDFHKQVKVAAYFLSQEEYSYDELCWLLAEKILKRTYKLGTPLSLRDTSLKAEEINYKSLHYDELCWLNAELDIIIKKYFDNESRY